MRLPPADAKRKNVERTAGRQLRDAVWEGLRERRRALIKPRQLRHEMFLSRGVVDTLDAIGRVIRLELSNIRYHEHFKGSWWEEGEKNRADFQQLCDLLLEQVRERAGELRQETSTQGDDA